MSGKALDAGRSTSMEREPNCSRVLEEDGAHALALVRRAPGATTDRFLKERQ